MTCPACGSTEHHSLRDGPHAMRQPVYRYDQTWRVHVCNQCGKMFMSSQKALTMSDATAWMSHLDSSTSTPPTDGSETEPESKV